MRDDADLVLRARRGNRVALAELVHRYLGSVRACVLARVGRHADVDDLVQQTFAVGIEKLPGLRDPSAPGAWLRGIARNLCRERGRDRATHSLDESPEIAATASGAEPSDLGPSPLARAVGELPEKLREALLLFYLEDLSYEEIGRQLEITSAAVNRRLTRARQFIRERLEGRRAAD